MQPRMEAASGSIRAGLLTDFMRACTKERFVHVENRFLSEQFLSPFFKTIPKSRDLLGE